MSQPVDNTGTNVIDGVNTPADDTTAVTPVDGMTLEEAMTELKKVRQEAASRRVANRDLEAQAKKWQEYEDSQKTELEKLQSQLAQRDAAIAQKDQEVLRVKIAKEFHVADEDLDLLVGDEENMKRLAARLGTSGTSQTQTRPTDLLAGNRGTPIGTKEATFSMDDFIRGSVRGTN